MQCVDCGPGEYSTIGLCLPCRAGSVSSGGAVACIECPSRYQPNDEQTECVCKAGTFDVEAIGAIVTCHGTSHSDGIATDECAVNNGGCDVLTECTNGFGSRICAPCPVGFLDSPSRDFTATTGNVTCVPINNAIFVLVM